jgi:O-antigen/teichoic acid export membrane protein
MFSIWVIIITLGITFKNNIIEIVSNKQYLEITKFNNYTSSDALTVILFMILFFYIWIIFSYLLIAIDKQKKLLKISIILTISNIIGNIILIPYYSFIWAWIVTVITQIIFLLLVYKETKNIINFKIPYIFIINILLFSIIIYLFLNYIIINYFSIGLFLDLIYWIFFFLIYIWVIWKIEKK